MYGRLAKAEESAIGDLLLARNIPLGNGANADVLIIPSPATTEGPHCLVVTSTGRCFHGQGGWLSLECWNVTDIARIDVARNSYLVTDKTPRTTDIAYHDGWWIAFADREISLQDRHWQKISTGEIETHASLKLRFLTWRLTAKGGAGPIESLFEIRRTNPVRTHTLTASSE